MPKGNRPWVDALRALAMLLVMIGHASHRVSGYFAWTSPVKIPLFFAISGFLFHADGYDSFLSFLRAKAKRLMIPYFILGALNSLCMVLGSWILLHEPLGALLRELAADFLKGEILWFIPCLFFTEIILYWIHRAATRGFRQDHSGWNHLVATLCCVLLARPGGFKLPWHLDSALMMTLFAELGFFLRRHEERLLRVRGGQTALLAGGYLILCWIQIRFGVHALNAGGNRWPCLPLNLLTCTVGVLALFALFPKLPVPSCVAWMGKNTMAYYAFHNILQMGFAYGLSLVLPIPDPESCLWMGIVVALAACVLCAFPSALINRFCPVIVGSRRRAPSGKDTP